MRSRYTIRNICTVPILGTLVSSAISILAVAQDTAPLSLHMKSRQVTVDALVDGQFSYANILIDEKRSIDGNGRAILRVPSPGDVVVRVSGGTLHGYNLVATPAIAAVHIQNQTSQPAPHFQQIFQLNQNGIVFLQQALGSGQ